ncbi:MAG: hypothetical protein WB630_16320 [Candidatus Acidiferrales bacterium]
MRYSDQYWKQLELRGRLGSYFASIEVDDLARFRRNNPSAPPGYMNEAFKPVFWEYCRLADARSRKLNLRALAKPIDSFSERLMASGLYREEELSAFWATVDDPQKIATHSAHLKQMGAKTLSVIVGRAARIDEGPRRPDNRSQPTSGPRFGEPPLLARFVIVVC